MRPPPTGFFPAATGRRSAITPRNPAFTWELGKSAYLGGRYESFKAGDPNAKVYHVQDLTTEHDLNRVYKDRRQNLRDAVDTLAKSIDGNDQITSYDEFQKRATEMVLSDTARKAFAMHQEKDALRDRYGRTTAGQSMLLARRLVESGVKFVTVNFAGWDHHSNIMASLDDRLPEFDTCTSALVQDMHDRGTFQNTLLVVMGEFGRTPQFNKDAGRDHWGPAGSMLIAGAGVRGGLVLGKTDKHGASVTQRPVSPADVACTMLESLGIDPRKTLVTGDGRPVEVLDQGAPIHELWA
jgi:membrane-anchored protein YejM (alkaline phosphatase superfamily)